jgi:hypothetical protein
MNFERYVPAQIESKKEEKIKLFPERAFASVDASIERLRKLQGGEIEKVELSEEERAEILSFENKLGTELEEIFKIKINSLSLQPEYLLTAQGRSLFRSCIGFDVDGDDIESIEKFIYRNRGRIADINGVQLSELTGQSKKYLEDQLMVDIITKMDNEEKVIIDDIKVPQPFTIVLNPENALDKIQKLRNFKLSLKNIDSATVNMVNSDDYAEVVSDIRNQYSKRVNEIIVDQFSYAAEVKLLADRIGLENLSKEELSLLEQFSGLSKFVSIYSKFDKFIFGVDGGVDNGGNYEQVGGELLAYANEMENKYIENELSKKERSAEKGLNFSKLMIKDISKDIFSEYAERFLEQYDQKSSISSDDFDPKRKGPALDGKWQFVARKNYSSMAVNAGQNIIKAPVRDRSVQELISILLGHEFVHFVQTLNQSKIKLKLYDSVGGDRRMVLAEGAAMSMQDSISEEMFGFNELPKPYYVKAMAKKLENGNYLDCVKEYYESSLNIYLKTRDDKGGTVSMQKKEELLGSAIRSCKRLFRSGEQLNARESVLSKSKDTVYLEQLIVMDKLKEAKLDKYAMVKGLNLDSLFVLLKNGFIKDDEIETLNVDFIRNAWSELRSGFLLEKAE